MIRNQALHSLVVYYLQRVLHIPHTDAVSLNTQMSCLIDENYITLNNLLSTAVYACILP